MRYQEVLSQAYHLTIRKPLLWLFGLVMLGGYNLFLINFSSIVTGSQWKNWPLSVLDIFNSSSVGKISILIAAIATFIILNLIKIIFIVVLHSLTHRPNKSQQGKIPECQLCVLVEKQQHNETNLPYLDWLGRITTASAVTIFLSVGMTLMINAVLSSQGYDQPVAVIINLLVIAAITCLIGTWNVFTGYFVILHGMNFVTASSAAIDLIVKHATKVLEFVVVLSTIYSLSVAVGNAFIHIWQNGVISQSPITVRALFLALLALWFAINNAFFNIAIFLFFIRVVKATPFREQIPVTAQF